MKLTDTLRQIGETVVVKAESFTLHISEEKAAHLRQLLGDELGLITHIEFDSQVARFFNVDAPVRVLHKLRAANLLRDDPPIQAAESQSRATVKVSTALPGSVDKQ